jgi:hypothetical protein
MLYQRERSRLTSPDHSTSAHAWQLVKQQPQIAYRKRNDQTSMNAERERINEQKSKSNVSTTRFVNGGRQMLSR